MAKDDGAFRMIDHVYYVGSQRVSSHLLASEEGHILIDTCMPEDGPGILKGIAELGFNPKDVRYILITHAHIDHLGSASLLAEQTGATLCIGEADVEAAEKGSTNRMGLTGFEPFHVDLSLKEGDVIAVGSSEVRVYHTPGHTPGCCSFGFKVGDNGRNYDAFLFGGPGLNVFKAENLRRGIYGGTRDDFQKTLDRLDTLDVEVWLGAHPGQNRTFQKHELLTQGAEPNPYADPRGWKAFLQGISARLRDLL